MLLLERDQQFPRAIKFDIVARDSRHCFCEIIEARASVLHVVGLCEPLNKRADISGRKLVDICRKPGHRARGRAFLLTDISDGDVAPPKLTRNPAPAGVDQANGATVFVLNRHIDHLDAQLPECLAQQYLIADGKSRIAFEIPISLGINARAEPSETSLGNEALKRSTKV